ncbi:MAG TPA: peptidase M28 [Bacteroidales bacterium]|nr:peptidase M28 [Bacteroidales bacterium]
MKICISYSAVIVLILIFSTSSCIERDLKRGENSINAGDMENYISRLASDEFMGRKPFTPGEKITVEYLAEQLERIGFEPAFGESYYQKVPMAEISSEVNGQVKAVYMNKVLSLKAPDDIAVTSPRFAEEINIKGSEMVFAGFGINAPGLGWNDYENLDVKGKTVIVLINDPGLYTGDASLFKGREMTYYGRWTYKFEEAARQGAEGILIIHETEGAGYQYTIQRKSSISPKLYMQTADSNNSHCAFTGWLSVAAADSLFEMEGYKISDLRTAACSKGFKSFNLKTKISLLIKNKIVFNSSTNIAGVLKGKSRADECIIYTAHWDHFGIGEKENGDSIYNGAVDNGTSMAWVFEIGEAFARLKNKPERSVMLFFPTAEEQGLLGSTYFTENPPLPMSKTVACFNNDLMLPIGRMRDVMITGYGQSTLDEMITEAAALQDRYAAADPNSHTGMYFRSDHFSFARKGVPSAFVRGNIESREHGKEWTAKMEKDYIENYYHRPSDNFEPETWNLEGIVEDAKLSFYVGYRLANTDYFPSWKPGSEFNRQ